jgi:urease accessory protein UreF
MTDKIVTYTPEQAEQLVAGYKAGEAVEALALQMGKSVRSVIAKLSREGVYQAKAKTGTATRVTKAVMVAAVSAALGVDTLVSLEKASHEDLEVLFKHFAK